MVYSYDEYQAYDLQLQLLRLLSASFREWGFLGGGGDFLFLPPLFFHSFLSIFFLPPLFLILFYLFSFLPLCFLFHQSG